MVLADSHRISPVPWYSGIPPGYIVLRLQDYHLLWSRFPDGFDFNAVSVWWALQPRRGRNRNGLGYSPFARHYLGNHCCFLFLRLLRCFSSPGLLRTPMYSVHDDRPSACRVAPFGNLRINGSLHLPKAYRSLVRPSSPIHAKASTVCP